MTRLSYLPLTDIHESWYGCKSIGGHLEVRNFNLPQPLALGRTRIRNLIWEHVKESQIHRVRIKVILRPTVGRPVCPGIRPATIWDPSINFSSYSAEIIYRNLRYGAPSLTRGRVCQELVAS
jgi:hypothetical protein